MAVQLTVHGGSEGSGTQALVQDNRGAFLFDCGASSANPALPALDGVLISHAHPRHTAGIPHLPAHTPLYSSVITAAILKGTQEITPGPAPEYVYTMRGDESDSAPSGVWRQRPYTFLLTQNDSTNPPGEPIDTFPDVHEWWQRPAHVPAADSVSSRPASVLPQFAPVALNGRALRHYPVDHSILGASAIAIETPDGWIGYTGDIRFHGQQPGLMEEFVQGFSELDLLALLVDGAHTDPRVTPTTENDVYQRLLGTVMAHDGLIVADFDALDMERLLTFHHIAEATRRSLVLSPRDAYMYLSMSMVWRQFPAFDAVDTFRLLNAPRFDASGNGWEAELRDRFQGILVAPDDLTANGGQYIVRSSPAELGVLETIMPVNGAYIRSRAATEDEDAILKRALAMGLSVASQDADNPDFFHSSGHATFDETIGMIKRLAPRHVIPLHSAQSEAFRQALAGENISVHTSHGHTIQIV